MSPVSVQCKAQKYLLVVRMTALKPDRPGVIQSTITTWLSADEAACFAFRLNHEVASSQKWV
jgi:hypothetical protein